MRYILSYAMDFMKLYVIETGIFGYRVKKGCKPLILALIFTAVYILAFYLSKDNIGLQALAQLIYLMTNIFTISAAIEGRKKLLISFASYLCLLLLDDSFMVAAANILGRSYSEINADFKTHYFLMLVSLGIYTLITHIIMYLRKKSSKNNVDLKESDNRYFWLLGASVVGVYVIGTIQRNTFYLMWIGMIVAALLAIIIQTNASKKYYENSSHVNEKIMDSQKAYYEEMLSREKETKKFRHDINNHMFCLKPLIDEGNYTEAQKYISDIDDKVSTLRNKYSTGNDLVNAIVNDISSKYEDVALNWNGLLPENLNISNMEICIIFSNLLDNAFCAASKLEKDGMVNVDVRAITNSLFFTIKNNMAGPINTKDSKVITSKPDKKNHGFGTMNVKECVAVIGGSVDYKFSDNDFSVDVVLPNVIT